MRAVTYYLRKDGATADGDTHLVTVATTTTTGYDAGVYDIIAIYPVFPQIIAKS